MSICIIKTVRCFSLLFRRKIIFSRPFVFSQHMTRTSPLTSGRFGFQRIITRQGTESRIPQRNNLPEFVHQNRKTLGNHVPATVPYFQFHAIRRIPPLKAHLRIQIRSPETRFISIPGRFYRPFRPFQASAIGVHFHHILAPEYIKLIAFITNIFYRVNLRIRKGMYMKFRLIRITNILYS